MGIVICGVEDATYRCEDVGYVNVIPTDEGAHDGNAYAYRIIDRLWRDDIKWVGFFLKFLRIL